MIQGKYQRGQCLFLAGFFWLVFLAGLLAAPPSILPTSIYFVAVFLSCVSTTFGNDSDQVGATVVHRVDYHCHRDCGAGDAHHGRPARVL